ncbi:hypothetical protein M885DRAFT_509944 [Pelagophyceae sp. CCMP2097]|nr:hypothetical protein M885DRAFT_509944 [Pelagophyceae sp. CCMP2097]
MIGGSLRKKTMRNHLQQLVRRDDIVGQRPAYIFMPHDPWRLCWDFFSSFLLVLMLFYIPYNVSFVGDSEVYDKFDVFITAFFSADMLLSFLTAFEAEGHFIVEPEAIAKHYLAGYFCIDLVATFPLDMALVGLPNYRSAHRSEGEIARLGQFSKLPRLFRYLRVFKLAKLARLYGKDSVVQKAILHAQLNPLLLRLGQIILAALVGSHLCACVWYTLGTNYEDKSLTPEDCAFDSDGGVRQNKKCTWLQVRGQREGDGNVYLYVTAMYWAVTTITTVGFGDVVPNSQGEMLYTCFVMVAGVTWYAVIISSVGKIYDSMDSKSGALASQLAVLTRFVHGQRVPSPLAAAMHTHLRHQFDAGHFWRDEAHEASRIIASLSKPLQRILALHLEKTLIAKIPFFKDKHRAFVADCAMVLQPLLVAAGELVLRRRRVADSLYFVVTGAVSIRFTLVPGARELGRVESGSYFGDEGCLLGAHWEAHLVAASPTELQHVSRQDLSVILANFPDVAEGLVEVAQHRLERAPSLVSTAHSYPLEDVEKRGARTERARPAEVGAFLIAYRTAHPAAPGAAAAEALRAALRQATLPGAAADTRLAAVHARFVSEERLVAEQVRSLYQLSDAGQAALYGELLLLAPETAGPASASLRRSF